MKNKKTHNMIKAGRPRTTQNKHGNKTSRTSRSGSGRRVR